MRPTGWLALALLGAGVGCTGSRSLTADHGKSYRAALRVQRAGGDAVGKQAEKGLDAQESAIVASAYRASLMPEGTKTKEPEILYVAPPRQGNAVLAPSVPRER